MIRDVTHFLREVAARLTPTQAAALLLALAILLVMVLLTPSMMALANPNGPVTQFYASLGDLLKVVVGVAIGSSLPPQLHSATKAADEPPTD